MPEATVRRTLVKSPPELWAEISEPESLARHLGEFGEIRITRSDPEKTVAWEGDRARGTVEIEAAGWGTKVTLTAEPVVVEPVVVEPVVVEPVVVESVAPAPQPNVNSTPSEQGEIHVRPVAKVGFWARLFGRKPADIPAPAPAPTPATQTDTPAPQPHAVPKAGPEPSPQPVQAPVVPLTPPASPEMPPITAAVVPVLDAARTEEILVGVLDDLGSAHHRPFSRS